MAGENPDQLLNECRSALLSFRRLESTRGLSVAAPEAHRLCDAFDRLDAFLLNDGNLPSTWSTLDHSVTDVGTAKHEMTFPAGPRESGVLDPTEEDVPASDTHDLFTFALAVAREKETPGTTWLAKMLRCEADVRDALRLYGIHVIQLDNHSDPDVLFYDGEKSTLPEEWQ